MNTMVRSLIRLVKPVLARTLYRPGSVARILMGPCRGLRYRIFPGFGLSAIYGGWETDAQRLMVRHIRRGSVVYDVGANYGMHTLLFARLVAPEGRVYAFEPVPQIHAALTANLQLNNFQNVTCVPEALSSSSGTACFSHGHHAGAGHLGDDGEGAERIPVATVTLDEFVLDRGNKPPDFIKLDVEGAEGPVLAGGAAVLERFRPTLIIDLHNPEQDVLVGQALQRTGYHAYRTADGQQVRDLSQGWPHPDGVWGQILAIAPQRVGTTHE